MLFTLLAERYERGSVLLTSNLPFSDWEAIFKDAMTTAAAIDRLVHHSVIVELNIPSYRAEQAKKKKADESNDRRNKKENALLNWRLRLQTSGIYRDPAIPGSQSQNRRVGGLRRLPPWSGPGSQRSGCIPAEPYPLLRSASV